MDLDFQGRVVAVSGAAVGFGCAIAHAFARRGARVFATDIAREGLAETAAALRGVIMPHAADLTDRAAAAAWIAGVERAAGGPVEVLVNNAGGTLGRTFRPLEELPDEEWDALLAANLGATFAVTRAAVPGMKGAGRGGRIVNISSGAGLRPSRTGMQAYTSAKHAVIGFTRQMAQELGPHGITVNAIAPGFFLTTDNARRQWEGYGPEGQRRLVAGIALRRLGEAEDIARAALFFASDLAGFVTGQALPVNGGSS